MSKKRFKGNAEKRDGGKFFALPHVVLESHAYLALSPYARTLLIDIGVQYDGSNNGDLCAAWKLMRKRGWKSQDTLNKAKRELLASGLLAETRKGCRPNKATLYGLTWLDLDYCGGKLDIKEKGFPRGAYRFKDADHCCTAKRM